jgi:hypothetical protein
MKGTEYRVTWKREGLRTKHRSFLGLAAAQRHAERLRTGDPHWRCDEGHGYFVEAGPDREWVYTCMSEIIVGPTIEERAVGPWVPVIDPADYSVQPETM